MLPSTGRARSQSPVAGLFPRDRLVVASCIVLITALAWAYLVHLHGEMSTSGLNETVMANMGMVMDAPWGVSDFFFTFVMWAVMMTGMMSPTAMPLLLLFSRMHAGRSQRELPMAVLLLGLGYITVWLGFSGSAALAQWGLHQSALLSPAMAATSSRLAGAILIAAGAYQLTPAKSACLRQCQSPLGFLMGNWREGPTGALEMGIRHGVYCLGCCWALMGVLFAVGVMNLAWVAALTAFILLEKIGPAGVRVSQAGGAAMIAFGLLVMTR